MLCNELGLGQEWVVQIAHAIYDRLLQDRKAAVLDDAPESVHRPSMLDTVTCFRAIDLDLWSPSILPLSQEAMNRKEISEDRESRRRRRGGRSLPNKDEEKPAKRVSLHVRAQSLFHCRASHLLLPTRRFSRSSMLLLATPT